MRIDERVVTVGAAEEVLFLCSRPFDVAAARSVGVGHVQDGEDLPPLPGELLGHRSPVSRPHLQLQGAGWPPGGCALPPLEVGSGEGLEVDVPTGIEAGQCLAEDLAAPDHVCAARVCGEAGFIKEGSTGHGAPADRGRGSECTGWVPRRGLCDGERAWETDDGNAARDSATHQVDCMRVS